MAFDRKSLAALQEFLRDDDNRFNIEHKEQPVQAWNTVPAIITALGDFSYDMSHFESKDRDKYNRQIINAITNLLGIQEAFRKVFPASDFTNLDNKDVTTLNGVSTTLKATMRLLSEMKKSIEDLNNQNLTPIAETAQRVSDQIEIFSTAYGQKTGLGVMARA